MSWLNLSDNLSNLSGNFTSITGQISNFTREVLTESSEEGFDQDTELKIAHLKIKDLENSLQKLKDEVDRVNKLNEELRDRSVSSELQIKALSDEYRGIIDQREKEIKLLQSSQADSKHGPYPHNKDESFAKEGMEYEDPEFFHMTVTKLKKELNEVHSECQYWKDAAKSQNNQAGLEQLKDHHQQEIASLQGTYSKRISLMNKKHQSELEDLMSENEKLSIKINEYEENLANKVAATVGNTQSAEEKDFEERHKKLSIDFEIKKKQLESLQIQILEEKRTRKAVEEENEAFLLKIKEMNEKVIELENEVECLFSSQGEKEKCVSFETDEREKLEEVDRTWRSKFDSIMQGLNEARDENVATSLELSQLEEKYSQLENKNEELAKEMEDANAENEKLVLEKKQLEENVSGLDKLKDDISRLGNCTSDLLEELEYQRGLSEEQLLEIDSLRKICSIKGSPADEIKKMHKSLKELGRRYVELYQHYQKVSLELRKSNDRLRAERQLRHTSVVQLREEIGDVQRRTRKSVESKLDSCKAESDQINSRLSELDEQLDRRERIVAELQLDNAYVSDDVSKSISELGHQSDVPTKSSLQNDAIESLVAEKSILERTIEGLERKVGSLEALLGSNREDGSTVDGNASPPRTIDNSPRDSDAEPSERRAGLLDLETSGSAESEKEVDEAKAARAFSLSDGANDGYFFDDEQPSEDKIWLQEDAELVSRDQRKISELQENVLILKKELSEINVIKSDLEFEKSTLEKVVLELQKKIKLKVKAAENDCSFIELSHQESETDFSSLEWDNLIEVTERHKILAEDFERAKENMKEMEDRSCALLMFVSNQFQRLGQNIEAKNSIEPANNMTKLEAIVHSYAAFSSQEIQRYSVEVEDRNKLLDQREEDLTRLNAAKAELIHELEIKNTSLAEVKQRALDVLKQIGPTRDQVTGVDSEAVNEDLSCDEVVREIGKLAENLLGSSSERDAEKWRTQYDEILLERSSIARDLTNMRDELELWKEKHREVVDENTSLLESMDMFKQDLEFMSQGQSALSAEREQLQSELDKLQFQIDTNETDDSKEIGELKMQLDDLKLERERIMKMVNDRDDFIVDQQEKHDGLVFQLMEAKDRDLQEIQRQLEETIELFKRKQEECNKLMTHNSALQEENAFIKETVKDLERKSSQSSRRIEKLELELNDKMQKAMEKDVILKTMEEEDEELREKEIIEEDMLREQEILIQDLKSENEYLRDEVNAKELLLKKAENSVGGKGAQRKEDALAKEIDMLKCELNQYHEMSGDIERWKNTARKFDNLQKKNEELIRKEVSYKKSIESLECKLLELGGYHTARRSPTIELSDSADQSNGDEEIPLKKSQEEFSKTEGGDLSKIEIIKTANYENTAVSHKVSAEESRLLEDFVKAEERIRELELEVETYKKFEMVVDQKEFEIEKLKSEIGRMMQVLRSKDELLLNLQMMEDEVDSDSPFSSRARVIQHIRDKETEIENVRVKCGSLEELAKHHSNQLDLLKVERQNLLIFLKQKEAEIIDLNEKVENTEARSLAKDHASTVLHSEHTKLTELNQSQGSEIARLRERNQYLQNLLQDKQSQSSNEKLLTQRNQQLEIQIAAFQQEQERLLTLIHEKDDLGSELKREIERVKSSFETTHTNREPRVVDSRPLSSEVRKESLMASQTGNDVKVLHDSLHSYEAEVSELKEKLRSLQENNSKLVTGNNELKQKLDLYDSEKRTIRTLMENQDYEKSLRIKDLEGSLNDMEKRVVDVNRNFELERSRMLQNFESRMKLDNQEWKGKVKFKEQEIKTLLEQMDLLQSAVESADKSCKSDEFKTEESYTLSLENKKLHSLYEEKKSEISILQNDVFKLKSISSAHEAALSKVQNENKYLIDEVSKKDGMIEELKSKKLLAEQKVQELETEVHRLKVNCREIEARATKDMERLRNHLLEIEEGYTNEAVAAQDRERDLEKKLHDFQELYQSKNAQFQESSNQSNFQIQNLQQQLFAIAKQRDDAVTELARVRDRALQTETALNNLQLVLERLQREKDSQYEMLEDESRRKLLTASKEIEDLRKKEMSFQARIQEATLAVQGVANLSKEVQSKESVISSLKKEVITLQEDVKAKSESIRSLKDSTEGKLEKPLMKNILLGYFHTPENKRSEVVRVLGHLVGFSQDEIDEIGTGAAPVQRYWVSTLIPFRSGPPKIAPRSATSQKSIIPEQLSKSFTEMFVSFLEEESAGSNRGGRPTSNQLTALLMETPQSPSSQIASSVSVSEASEDIPVLSGTVSNPLLITPQDARVMHATTFKTNLPLLKGNALSAPPSLFPAPGQEIPRVHTSTANSALRTMLSK